MPIARVVGAVGRAMMASGAILLLFVAYQLWGTGIQAAREQDRLEQEFAEMQAQLGESETASTDAEPPGASDTPDTQVVVAAAPTDLPPLDIGDPLGNIRIPEIGVDWNLLEGVPLSELRNGPGHFPGTPLPGQAGNSAIAGHRTTWGAPFNRIDELRAGDSIEVTTLQGTFFYSVIDQPAAEGAEPRAHAIVRPWETELIEPTERNLLTLVACHPEYSARQRIIVQAELTSPPAPDTPGVSVAPDEETANAMLSDEVAGGDPSAWPAAIGFGLAAAGVWLGAWLLARRTDGWRAPARWAVYAAALVPFAVLLFFCFENVNRLLPAAY